VEVPCRRLLRGRGEFERKGMQRQIADEGTEGPRIGVTQTEIGSVEPGLEC
jgi:hypothetical protein